MSTYATKQTFSGQRASISRNVLLIDRDRKSDDENKTVIHSGVIVDIDVESDLPMFIDLTRQDHHGRALGSLSGMFKYVEVESEFDLMNVPAGSWCWPPRV